MEHHEMIPLKAAPGDVSVRVFGRATIAARLTLNGRLTILDHPVWFQEAIYLECMVELIISIRVVGKLLKRHGGNRTDLRLIVGGSLDWFREQIGEPL